MAPLLYRRSTSVQNRVACSEQKSPSDKNASYTAVLQPSTFTSSDLRSADFHNLEKDQPSTSDSNDSGTEWSIWRADRKQKTLLIYLALTDLTTYLSLSIMAPFFPKQASKVGISTSLSGWIFGIFPLVQFIFSPLIGKLLPIIGSKFMFIAGQFIGGGCTVLFGFLAYVPTSAEDNLNFIILSFALRFVMALGCSANATSGFAIALDKFPNRIGVVFGFFETFIGIGQMSGPGIGGFLYEAGGFVVPFVLLGSVMLLSVLPGFFILKDDTTYESDTKVDGVLTLLRRPSIILVSLAVIVGGIIWSILDPTLEPRLAEFNLSPGVIGLMFLLMAAFYAITAPIWGWISDKLDDNTWMMIFGFLLAGIGMLVLGPSPIFQINNVQNYFWMNIVALIILGIAASLSTIPTFDYMLYAAEEDESKCDFGVYSLVAGLWSSMYALGDFIGPSVGGIMVDRYGFPLTMTYIGCICGLMSFCLLVFWTGEKVLSSSCRRNNTVQLPDERTPLLSSKLT